MRALAFVSACLMGAGCSSPPPPPPPPAAAPAAPEPTAAVDHANTADRGWQGVIVARNAVNMAAKVDGTLQDVKVRVGDHVKVGQLVAMVDVGPVRHELALAQAMLQQAKSQQRKAWLDLSQASEHAQRQDKAAGYMTEEELATGHYQRSLASAAVGSAHGKVSEEVAHLQQLRETIANAELRAPFEGVISEVFAQPGTVVARGAVILRIITADQPLVRFAIPADQRQAVTAGSSLSVELSSGAGTLRAEVVSVSPEVDAASGLVVAEASLEQEDEHLASVGTLARVHLIRPLSAQKQTGAPHE